MNYTAKLIFSIGLLALVCAILPGSLRADTFNWTYSSTDAIASGQLTAVPEILAGLTDITSIDGTFNGVTITGLDNTILGTGSTLFYPPGVLHPDHPDTLIADFIGFDWNGDLVVVGTDSTGYFDRVFNGSDTAQISFGFDGTFTLTPSTSTEMPAPEPSGARLLTCGLLGLCAVSYFRRVGAVAQQG
jgi:hypothetical protein